MSKVQLLNIMRKKDILRSQKTLMRLKPKKKFMINNSKALPQNTILPR